jgi:hypothetical protein
MNWVEFTVEGPHPPERRCVLIQFEKADGRYGGMPPTVVVGYLRYAAGCKDSPYFVTPGFDRTYVPKEGVPTSGGGTVQRQSTHWCDCLGDDFEAPLWEAKDMNRRAHQP